MWTISVIFHVTCWLFSDTSVPCLVWRTLNHQLTLDRRKFEILVRWAGTPNLLIGDELLKPQSCQSSVVSTMFLSCWYSLLYLLFHTPYVRFCVKFYLFVYSDILGTASSQQAKLLKVELGSMWYNTQLII